MIVVLRQKYGVSSMTVEQIDSQHRTPARIALHILGGILMGLIIVAIPFALACESPSGLQPSQVMISVGFVALCGIVSAIGGEKILDRIADMAI
jgi:uncharacterized membrane protein